MGMGGIKETRTQIGMAIDAVKTHGLHGGLIEAKKNFDAFKLERRASYETARAELQIGKRLIETTVYIDNTTYAVGINIRADKMDAEVIQLFEAIRSPRDKHEKLTHRKHEKQTLWHIGYGYQTADGSYGSYSLLRTLDTAQDKRKRLKYITPAKKAKLDSEPAGQKLSDFCKALRDISGETIQLLPLAE